MEINLIQKLMAFLTDCSDYIKGQIPNRAQFQPKNKAILKKQHWNIWNYLNFCV